jgi:hypothetical protein
LRRLEFKTPKMTRVFWVSFFISYLLVIIAIYGIVTTPQDIFDVTSKIEVQTAFKLATVRLAVAGLGLLVYPALLWCSLKWSKYFVVSVTAWAIAMYLDDYLVLYRVIEYPDRGVIVFFQATRPLLILSLIWMSFELSMKPKDRR